MKKSFADSSPKKILIRSTNWIGDAIMTTPAIRTIRRNFPEARIAILVHPWVADVFAGSPDIDQIIYYQKKKEHAGITGRWRLARELTGHRFDMAIVLQNAFEAALLTTLAGIPVRAGYRRDGRSLLLSHPVSIDPQIRKIHQVHYYQHLLEQLGLNKASDQLCLEIPEEHRQWAETFLQKEHSIGPVIGLNPGAAYGPAKRWPAQQYGELAALLQGRLHAAVLVFGTEADKDAAAAIQALAGKPILDLTGRTNLAQAMALIQKCDGFVTNDSGLMHVGAALQTPLLAIFGSTNHITTGPFSDNSQIIRKELDCSPCLKTHCQTDFQCMVSIKAEEVFDQLATLLEIRH